MENTKIESLERIEIWNSAKCEAFEFGPERLI